MRSARPKTGARLSGALAGLLAAGAAGVALSGDLKGFGSAQCGELNAAWNESGADDRALLAVALGQWAFGYMSGRNVENPPAERRELAAFENDSTAAFILGQCRTYPNFYVVQIVDALYDSAPRVRPEA